MANIALKLKKFLPLNINRFNSRLNPILSTYSYQTDDRFGLQSRRNLYSDEVLGVDRFAKFRKIVIERFGTKKEKFIEVLNEHINGEKNVILSEDLKNLIFLCDNKEQDIELLKKGIQKFEKQNESLRFGLFQFGPVVMRLAKLLNNVDMAMWIFNPKFKEFFPQLSSVTIAMDILFDNKRYEDVIKLYNYAMKNLNIEIQYPVDCVVLYFAACYKLNTLKSFEDAFHLLRSMQVTENQAKLRGLYFFLTLALNQNHSNIALEVIHQTDHKHYHIVLQSIRLLANAKTNRFVDTLDILRFNLRKDRANLKSKIIFQKTLDEIIALFKESKKEEFTRQLDLIVKNLNESNLIEKENTLDDVICRTINFTPKKFRESSTDKIKQSIKQ